jgi:cyclase
MGADIVAYRQANAAGLHNDVGPEVQIRNLDRDILMFRGEAYESIATAFIDENDVLLVDALASLADAQTMRSHLEVRLGKRVRTIALTHGMADHRAGVPLFPDAALLAHPRAAETMRAGTTRPSPDIDTLVARISPIDDAQDLTFGRHHLRFFHNEGKSPCSVSIEVRTSDLLFTGDNLLGQIAFISRSTPELILRGIERIEARSGSRLVEGHQGVFSRDSIAVVRHYLRSLGRNVAELRGASEQDDQASIMKIRIEDCLPRATVPTDFEREWHGHNLTLICSRNLFSEPLDQDRHEFSSCSS